MTEHGPGEADALLRAITGLLPFANGAAGDVVSHLKKTLAVMLVGEDVPSKEANKPAAIGSKTAAVSPPRPNSDGATRFQKRVDAEWPALLARLRQAMTVRNTSKAALARAVAIPNGTLVEYLGKRVPPEAVKRRLVQWLDASAVPEVAAPAPAPFRIGATEAIAART